MSIKDTFKAHPFLFIFGCLFNTSILVAVVSAVLLSIGMQPDLIGKSLGPVVFFAFLPLGEAFVIFVKGGRARSLINSITTKLDTPAKRGIFLFVPAGLALIILSWFLHEGGTYLDDFFYYVAKPLHQWDWYSGSDFASLVTFWTGASLLMLGLLFSFAYEKTIGLIVCWVKGK